MSTTRLLKGLDPEERNQLYYEPPSIHGKEDGPEYLIFMITGNPGFISFYEPFLSTLHTLLSSSSSRFYISGYSLAGFHASPTATGLATSSLVGLQGQIDHMERKLFKQVDALRRPGDSGSLSPKVILMGHSVGAYILLELIRQHRMRIDEGEKDFDLIGGILLFPTITHIAQSPLGVIYNVSLSLFPICTALISYMEAFLKTQQTIFQVPHFPHIASALVRLLFYLIPAAIVFKIVKILMRYPEHAARTSASLIKSPVAIRQAL
jgi:hypothetical protein